MNSTTSSSVGGGVFSSDQPNLAPTTTSTPSSSGTGSGTSTSSTSTPSQSTSAGVATGSRNGVSERDNRCCCFWCSLGWSNPRSS
ncbi:hypothetical protein NA56DRAFT_152040 [Hyaloscypha hepaticicola]|uniref:Uncharacterized protein n=1 Tax=Hyaloscypha hepaticicola TaxID=2082293 RepID=A0A2J6QNV3_9HELO|nr:hypothetical protein NA56DRAFT_152040 [Hyaloscypha hepaticicola]